MSFRCFIPLGILAPLLLMPGAACAEISARLSAKNASMFIHEPFTLRLEVESDAPPDTPELPAVPDLAVTTIRRLPSDPTQRKHVFQIELISERDGVLTIPPFVVRAKGQTTLTPALRLQISRPRPAGMMSLQVIVEPTTLRLGQPATVTVTWSSKVSFERCKQLLFEIPLLTDGRFHVFSLAPEPESKEVGLPVNNVRVVAQAGTHTDGMRSLVFRYKLIPNEPCVLRSTPVRILCALLKEEPSVGESPSYFYNHFFEATGKDEVFDEVYLTARIPEITVRDVAEAGRTSRYADIVGPCTLRTSVSPRRLTVGQPALLTLKLEDLAFARHIPRLPSAAFDGMRSEFQLSQEPIRENATDTARSFTYVLRPLRARITRVPAVVIQTFDPDTGTFRTIRSKPISITVEEGQEDRSPNMALRIDSESPIPVHGVRHNRLNEPPMTSIQNVLEFLGQFWWVFVPLPPLLWLALRPLARRWERCRRDPVFARALAAWWRFRRTAWRDEETAWRAYLADRLALCADALTADTVTEALRARNVDTGLVAEARRRFEEKDAAEYGQRPATSSQGTHSLVRRLQKATIPVLLITGFLLPLRANAADQADVVFARATKMRGDKPDEAKPLFVEAALQFESEGRFLNAGNSWFFAGENGRALANYRAAERRAPFDHQLRESIEFLRANRADAFPKPAAPAGAVSAAWNRYGTWDPELRVGSFVIAYLLAWMVFLTTQLTGRHVPRGVWFVLLVAPVVPLVSLAHSSLQPAEGVVIEDTVARLGPGYAYDPAFKQPLHKATEFVWLETRHGWVLVRLPDASKGWLREFECMKVN